jgi:hypothetical protein
MNTDDNSFDPTPRLKSSSVPVLFIPFNCNEEICNYCGIEYSETIEFEQKYCKNCLFWYIKYTTDNNDMCLDTYITTNNAQCIVHGKNRNNFNTINIQEWCEYCSEVSYFRQIIPSSFYDYLIGYCVHYKLKCELCDKQWSSYLIEHGQNCYQIFPGWVESILTKKPIPILNLPWWHHYSKCILCVQKLEYMQQEPEYCQKWCSKCYIFYIGCRYCLTTNIIFGIADQSQCKKCKRISFITIDITNISSGSCIVDEFLFSTIDDHDNYDRHSIADYIYNDTSSNPLKVYNFIEDSYRRRRIIKWIPYSQIKNLKKLAEGGFSTIYKATWANSTSDSDVAVKKLFNSQNISKYFLNEVKFNI